MTSVTTLHEILDETEWKLEKIKTFLEKDSSSVNEVNFYGETPLQRVLFDRMCSDEIVELLLNHGADVNSRDDTPPLIRALLRSKSAAVIRMLLEKGADVHVIGESGNSPLCIALSRREVDKDVVQLLLDSGCSIDSCRLHHGFVLRCATNSIEPGLKKDTLYLLMKKGVRLNAVDIEGRSCLCHALGRGNKLCVIEMLLAAGNSLNACQLHATPMHCVTDVYFPGSTPWLRKGVVEVLLRLIENTSGKLPNPTPLQWALRWCNYETKAIELLLDHFQDANIVRGLLSNTLLHLAVCNPRNKPSVVKLLVKRGAKVDMVNTSGNTALHESLKHSFTSPSIVKTLIEGGSPLNLRNLYGLNPLQVTARYLESVDIFKMLFCAGARIGATGDSFLKNVVAEKKLVYCKMLVKCYFLENPDFDFQYLIQGHRDYEALSRFGADCMHELQKLDSKNVSQGLTLREFLTEHFSRHPPAAKCYDFNQLLGIIAENKFPIFFDIIAEKIGRSTMEKKLEEVEVYVYMNITQKCASDQKKRVTLNYVTVCLMAKSLGDDDLLNFITAFHKMDHRNCTTQDKEDKRKDEHSEQGCKRPRLQV